MPKEHILVVEDDEDIQELVRFNLAKEGYRVTCVASGEDGLQSARTRKPDLILLDLMLPGTGGLEVCRGLKTSAETSAIPIVMLTAKGEESDIVVGLEVGAADYVIKPFSPKVLLARVRSVLRRAEPIEDADEQVVRSVHDVVVHPGRNEVTVKGKRVVLTHTEFRLLHLLARRPGWVFTRSRIVDAVKGIDHAVTDRSVDVHVVSLRRKLGTAGKCLETVRGVGYRFKE